MFQCYYSDCISSYKTRFNLRRHINSFHLKIKNFVCHECNKLFVSKQNLKEHHFIHTGEKPFICNYSECSKCFRQASQLTIHKKIHFRKNLGKTYFQQIPRLLLSSIELNRDKIEEIQDENSYDFTLPDLHTVKLHIKVKLPILPCLLSIKEISNII